MKQPQQTPADRDDEVNLVSYWQVIRKRWKVIFFLLFIAVAATTLVSFLIDPTYQAKTTLMAVESSQTSFTSALGALQNLPFVGGAVSGSLGKTATDKFVSILNSRTVAETVIQEVGPDQGYF